MSVPGAYGAHPLNTEDTGTQGRGRWQLELNGERSSDAGEQATLGAALLSYGIAGTLDVQAGIPYTRHEGKGDALAAVKWRFWEREPWSLGVRAGATFPTGDEQRGLGNGKTTWAALLIGQYEGERWIFLSHLGYRDNRNSLGNRESIGEVSGAVLYKATEKLKLLIDANRTTNPDPGSDTALRQSVAGLILSPTKDVDLDVGVRRGNEPAIDKALMLGAAFRW